jgi:hypothetical protein
MNRCGWPRRAWSVGKQTWRSVTTSRSPTSAAQAGTGTPGPAVGPECGAGEGADVPPPRELGTYRPVYRPAELHRLYFLAPALPTPRATGKAKDPHHRGSPTRLQRPALQRGRRPRLDGGGLLTTGSSSARPRDADLDARQLAVAERSRCSSAVGAVKLSEWSG